jgi:hypothetical protein
LSGKPFADYQRLQPNTSKPSTEYQNKLRKVTVVLTLAVKLAGGVSKFVHSEVTYSTNY